MKLDKAERRDKKRQNKRKHITDGRGVFLLQEIQKKKSEAIKKKRKQKKEDES